MPGFSGIIDTVNRVDNPQAILTAFENVQALQGVKLHHKSIQTEVCVIVNTLTGLLSNTLVQPASVQDGNTVLFLEGEIFNEEALRRHLKDRSETGSSSVCDLLLALFLERGPNFVSLVNGEFNIVIYQRLEKRLFIFNDHLATKPLYYMQQGKVLLFGSEKKAILAVSKETPQVDPAGMLQIFLHQHNLNATTFIRDLKSLTPGSILSYRDGQLSLSHYKALDFEVSRVSMSTTDLIDAWCDHLRRATVGRIAGKERITFFLSAGLDSRAVAVAVPRDMRPIFARTRGVVDSLEVKYASQIARRLNFDHFRDDPLLVPFSDFLHKTVWRTEGAVSFIHCQSTANHVAIKSLCDFIVGGQLGDISSGGHISPVMLIPRDRGSFIDMVCQRYPLHSFETLRSIFNGAFLKAAYPQWRASFIDSFASIEAGSNIHLYEIWDLIERQPHLTFNTAQGDSHLFGHIRPFVDKDYLNFVMRLSKYLRFGQTLYQAMIHRLGPEIQDIPNANNDLRLKGSVWGNLMNKSVDIGRKGQTKIMRKVRPGFRNKIEKAASADHALIIRQDLRFRQIIELFVASPDFDETIFDRKAILTTLNAHYQGAANHADLLCSLATFAVGLSYFVYNRPTHSPPEAEPLANSLLA